MNNNALKQFSLEDLQREILERKCDANGNLTIGICKNGTVISLEYDEFDNLHFRVSDSIEEYEDEDWIETLEFTKVEISTLFDVVDKHRSKRNARNY